MKPSYFSRLAASLIVLAACQTPPGSNSSRAAGDQSLSSGDIVFQDSSPHSGQAAAIKALTRSEWSHCGIYFERPGGAVVIDGNGQQGAIAWQAWRDRGEGRRFAAYRLKNRLSEEGVRQLWLAANSYDAKPYDLKFAWGNAEIYCSELIWKAYQDALGVDVGRVQRLQDFDLHSPLARKLIERPGSWGTVANAEAHGDERVVSPQAIVESERLERVR